MTKARVLWPNVHTSQGKFLKGDEITDLPAEELKDLDNKDAVKIVKPGRPKKDAEE